ncbi:hypothetical protein FOMPIDRAFT_1052503 [Fomitopsis schrenkii]|uniref:Uncharacterized protein n=1 Tax=Fomitopsis schrenkii TaxID=2126942 RepID=S8DXE3_FOMSC|nr:hypothetical protein FOMPIDRAFT_1052503 [Fomitopsis schrenkii]
MLRGRLPGRVNLRTRTFEDELAFHIACTKIMFIDAQDQTIKPNGLKSETSVFDVFPFTKCFAVLELEIAMLKLRSHESLLVSYAYTV